MVTVVVVTSRQLRFVSFIFTEKKKKKKIVIILKL